MIDLGKLSTLGFEGSGAIIEGLFLTGDIVPKSPKLVLRGSSDGSSIGRLEKGGKSFSQLKKGGAEGTGAARDIGGTDNNSTDCQ